MTSITIDLSDSQFQKLQDLAKAHEIVLEVLLRSSAIAALVAIVLIVKSILL